MKYKSFSMIMKFEYIEGDYPQLICVEGNTNKYQLRASTESGSVIIDFDLEHLLEFKALISQVIFKIEGQAL